MEELRTRVAVITGGASGIGLALARALADAGMRLALADIEPDALERAVAALRAGGATVTGHLADVSDGAAVDTLAGQVFAAHGQVDLLCNNAGVFTGGLSWEATEADWHWVLGVNLWGVIHGVRAFLPRIIAQGTPAHVVNVASMAGLTSMPFAAVYHTSKHAVVGYTECLYHDLALNAPQVGVSLVCPEMIRTGIAESARNRPPGLRGELNEPQTAARQFVEGTIRAAAAGGLDPGVIAARTLAAVRERRFYVLAEDGWMQAARSRMDDVANRRNPVLAAPA